MLAASAKVLAASAHADYDSLCSYQYNGQVVHVCTGLMQGIRTVVVMLTRRAWLRNMQCVPHAYLDNSEPVASHGVPPWMTTPPDWAPRAIHTADMLCNTCHHITSRIQSWNAGLDSKRVSMQPNLLTINTQYARSV